MKNSIFTKLVYDTNGSVLESTYVGTDPFYVLDDDGFMRHIPAEDVDRQIWKVMTDAILGNEDLLSRQAAKMMGQEDIFSVAIIRNQLENVEDQFAQLQNIGLPSELRDYLQMNGFRAIVDFRGQLISLVQPEQSSSSDSEDE